MTRQPRAEDIRCGDVATFPGTVVCGGFHDPDGKHIEFANRAAPPR